MPGLSRTFAIAISLVAATTAARADVVITPISTHNMTCSAGVCSPTKSNAFLNVYDLESMLASGNVVVTTTGSGVQANNIRIEGAFGWSSANTLELDANGSITIDQPVSINGIAGLTTNSQDGTLSFGTPGNITFANTSSALIINSVSYTLVNTVQSLAGAITANPSGDFAMAASYDASGDGTYQFSPIQSTFVGSFEGLGNTISNLMISDQLSSDTVGLFKTIGGGLVTNLRLEDINLHARGQTFVGGLAGTMTGGLVSNVSVSGKTVAQTLSTNGGLVGLNAGGSIANAVAHVAVTGGEYVGGLVGQNGAPTPGVNSTITDSQAHGPVKSTSKKLKYVGGLVGFNDYHGLISACYATGHVLGGAGSSAGGLIGINIGGSTTNSYASGPVIGGSDVGGFVGTYNSGSIDDSYSTGPPSGGGLVGGFVGGYTPGDIADLYWDTTTSGTDRGTGGGNVSGITGLTTEQLQSGLPPGFDPAIWAEDANIINGLPFLIANPPK